MEELILIVNWAALKSLAFKFCNSPPTANGSPNVHIEYNCIQATPIWDTNWTEPQMHLGKSGNELMSEQHMPYTHVHKLYVKGVRSLQLYLEKP